MNTKITNALSAIAILSTPQGFEWDNQKWQGACAVEDVVQDMIFQWAGLQ